MQFRLPFDPSLAFHKYAMSWNAKQIVFYIDNIPIRVVNRTPAQPWPTHAMKAQVLPWQKNLLKQTTVYCYHSTCHFSTWVPKLLEAIAAL